MYVPDGEDAVEEDDAMFADLSVRHEPIGMHRNMKRKAQVTF